MKKQQIPVGESHWDGRWIGVDNLTPGDKVGVQYNVMSARYLRKEFRITK